MLIKITFSVSSAQALCEKGEDLYEDGAFYSCPNGVEAVCDNGRWNPDCSGNGFVYNYDLDQDNYDNYRLHLHNSLYV